MTDTTSDSLDLATAQRRAAAFAWAMEQAAPTGPRTGHDPTGSVTVTVDPDGRTSHIDLADTWATRIAPEQLAQAIVAAARAAEAQGMTDFLTAIAALPESLDEIEPPRDYLEQKMAQHATSILELERTNPRLDEVVAMLDQATANATTTMAQIDQPATTPEPEPPAVSLDDPISFTLTARGGITVCAIDPTWIRRFPGSRVGDELNSALAEHLERN